MLCTAFAAFQHLHLQALVLAKKAMKGADDQLDDELGLGLGFDDPSYSCAPEPSCLETHQTSTSY